MEKKFSVVREVWLGIGLVAFSAFFLSECRKLNENAAQYPRVILSVLLAFSIALLGQGIWYSFRPEKYQARYGKSTKSVDWNVVANPLIVFGATIVYLALFHYINFFVATAIFVPLIMWIFKERRVLNMLLVTVGLELFVWGMFVKLLHVYFPL